MKKVFVFLSLGFLILLYVFFVIQQQKFDTTFSNVDNVYIFHGVFSIVICWALYFISKIEKYFSLIGFFYMATFILKGILFFGIFGVTIFSGVSLSNENALLLLSPLFLALTFEVVFMIKILSNLGVLKND